MAKEAEDGTVVPDVVERNGLARQLRFQDHLLRFGLGAEQAQKMVSPTKENDKDGMEKYIYGMVKKYIEEANGINSRNVFVKTHSVLGQRVHLSVGRKTINEYIRRVTKLIYFMYEGSKKEEDRKEDVYAMMSCEQKEIIETIAGKKFVEGGNEAFQEFHRLLFTMFLSIDPKHNEPVPLFIACSAVMVNEEEPEGCYYGDATDLSPLLAALLYLVQCITVYEVYGAGKENCNEVGFSLTRVGGVEWGDIEKAVEKKMDCGATYVRHCMNVCYLVRDSELSHIRFIVCQKHRRCGFLDGKELALVAGNVC